MPRNKKLEVPVLVQRAKEGDPAAVGELADRFRDEVRQYLDHLAPDAAEDLSQEVFINLSRSLRGYEESGRFREWLKAVAYNRFRTWLRGEVRKGMETLHTNAFGTPSETTTLFRTAKEKLHAVVEQLPPAEKEVWDLHAQGYAPRDIAKGLKLTPGAVYTRLNRAKGRLENLIIAALDPD